MNRTCSGDQALEAEVLALELRVRRLQAQCAQYTAVRDLGAQMIQSFEARHPDGGIEYHRALARATAAVAALDTLNAMTVHCLAMTRDRATTLSNMLGGPAPDPDDIERESQEWAQMEEERDAAWSQIYGDLYDEWRNGQDSALGSVYGIWLRKQIFVSLGAEGGPSS